MTMFIGPVAEQGGPAIKNRITLKYLFKGSDVFVLNTYSRRTFDRVMAIVRTKFAKDQQIIVAVSSKGRKVLWPIIHAKKKANNTFRYSLICIGGTIAQEAERNSKLLACLKDASVVAVETKGIRKELQQLGVNDPFVMTNFVDGLVNHLNSIKDLRKPDCPSSDVVRFVYLSSVREKKGVGTMVKAARMALGNGVNLQLDIYGPIKKDFDTALIDGLKKTEPISYKGEVANNEVIDTLKQYDCFIFPSEYETEGFPAVLAEAMAAGLPIIASDVSYNPEIIRNGRNGWLFPSGDASRLSELMSIVASLPGQMAKISMNNIYDCSQYDAESVVNSYRNKMIEMGWTL